MPSYTRGKKRETLVFVAVNSSLRYGWKRKDLASLAGISTSDLTTTLGHTEQNDVTGSGIILVVGASAPNPPRVSKKIANATIGQQQSVSTFCAYDKVANAILVGWNLGKPKRSVILKAATAGRASMTAVAVLGDGSRYAFPMNKADFDSYGAELGLQQASQIGDTERLKLVSGSSKPRPGRASKTLADGSTFNCFYSTSEMNNLSTAGYDILSEEITLVITSGGAS